MSNKEFESIAFDLPKNKSNVIKVIGVGGGGSNAINHMFQQGIKGVDFVICNTDAQALQNSGVPNKIQLGINLTEGLGAGADPDVGMQSAVESFSDIQQMLGVNTKMVFITAGMGGGTGTGAAPIIAKMAKEMDILTVGIVTMPFQFEGKMRNEQAQIGIEKLRAEVDSLIVINNNKLREVYGNLGFKAGFSKADEVLATASRGIAEVITHHYTQNIDLRDAKTVLSNSGTAIMGSSTASGQNRANDAISQALDSPLLNDNKITGAKNVLLLIVSGSKEITIDEIGEINDHIQAEAGHGANIIMGVGEDDSLEESIAVTIIATGFNVEQQDEISNTETKKVVHALEEDQSIQKDLTPNKKTPVIIVENTIKEKPEPPKVVKHTLNFDEEIEDLPSSKIEISLEDKQPNTSINELGLISDAENIENTGVVSEEGLDAFNTDEAFVITSTKNEKDLEHQEEQVQFNFDLPVNEDSIEPETTTPINVVHNLENLEDSDYVEEVLEKKQDQNNEIRYTLEDYKEDVLEKKSQQKTIKVEAIEDKEILFERKVVTTENLEVVEDVVDPTNSPISEALKENRRQKLKSFNHKFNASKVDEIEKIPAYKRQGLSLDETQYSSLENNVSKTTLSIDDNDDIQLRNNNSFLHDNVD